jgi:hypothetical protein
MRPDLRNMDIALNEPHHILPMTERSGKSWILEKTEQDHPGIRWQTLSVASLYCDRDNL